MAPDNETSVTACPDTAAHVDWVSNDFDPALVTDLDVRELVARGMPPLPVILELADALEPGRVLHVRSPFQPTPLYDLLASRGFEHSAARFAEDDWSSWFWLGDHPPRKAPEHTASKSEAPEGVTDLRPLPPPEPLLWILRWVNEPDAPQLRVMLPFFPTMLAGLIGQDGWKVVVESESADGVVVRVAR